MRTLALPLRVTPEGQLERAEAAETLLALVRAMVAASPGGGARFGVHPLFRSANPALHDQQGLADALNDGLAELGIGWARVASVHTAAGQPGERSFAITLRIDGEPAVHGRVRA